MITAIIVKHMNNTDPRDYAINSRLIIHFFQFENEMCQKTPETVTSVKALYLSKDFEKEKSYT